MNTRPEIVARAGALEPLIVRALAAHYQTRDPAPVAGSVLAELDGKRYVILHDDAGGLVRVYRVRNDGVLSAMRRPPHALEGSR